MIIFLFIALLIIGYALVNFKKAFLIFLVFRLFLNQNINLLNIPGIPLLTLETGMVLYFFLAYLYKKKTFVKDQTPFPLKKAFIFYGFSYGISSIFAIAGLNNTFSALVKFIFEDLISIWMMWVVIKDEADIKFLIKWLTIAFAVISLYGIYESTVQKNPLASYEISYAGSSERVLYWNYDIDSYRGYRIKSVFSHAIGAGINYGIFILLASYLIVNYKFKYIYKVILFFVGILSLLCLFFTNSRGPLVFILLGMFSFFKLKNKSFIYLIFGGSFLIFLLHGYIESYIINLFSLFDSHAAEQVGGSNADMRLDQLDAAVIILKQSPIYGLGIKGSLFLDDLSLKSRLLGLESIWFWIITEQGLIGICSYVYLMYTLVYKIGKKNRFIFFVALAYFITATITSTPGLRMYFLYLIIFIAIKLNILSGRSTYQKIKQEVLNG